MRKFKDESGQVLVMVALSMTVLIGFVGFATDVGMLLREKRIAQSAADGAAIGAATEALYERNWTTVNSNMYNSAVLDASLNGYTTSAGNGAKDSSTGVTLTVYAGPNITIPGYSSAGNFQAIVTRTRPTVFMNVFGQIFGSNFSTIDVTATAIASNKIASNGCGYFPNGNGYSPAVTMGGSSEVFATTCGISVNGNVNMGGNSNITAQYLVATGDVTNGGSSDVTGQMAADVGGVISDPWQYLRTNAPTAADCATGTLAGGMSCIYDQGCSATSCSLSGTLQPNTVYYYDKGLNITGTVRSTAGYGNTIFLAGTTPYLAFTVNGTVDITPPGTNCPDNQFCGVVIDAPQMGKGVAPNRCVTGLARNYDQPGEIYFDFGSSTGMLEGDVYAPYAELFVQDQGASFSLANDFVLGTFCSQAATLNVGGFSGPLNPNTRVGLVY